jgi:hypothetical protein
VAIVSKTKIQCCDIIVIDDNRRFPFHLWHFLSRYTGFGIGDIGDDPDHVADGTTAHCFWNDKVEPQPLELPSWAARIWWVDASEGEWLKRLGKVLDEARMTKLSPRLFVIDVRGGEPNPDVNYSPQIVLDTLGDALSTTVTEKQLVLVSSYVTAPQKLVIKGSTIRFQVATKTSRTFWDIMRRLQPVTTVPDGRSEGAESLHVLVTGAGVEFADKTFGGSCLLGMPPTPDLLTEALEEAKLNPTRAAGCAFPVPGSYVLASHPDIHEAAKNGRLDHYWNLLLAEEFKTSSLRADRLEGCEEEARLRDCFRGRLLHYDWGHLPQSVEAARLNWSAWLTTNYTRFADRAIQETPRSQKFWEVIATSNEAKRLRRYLLHTSGRRNRWRDCRYVFKLHGDIAHLTTMAIAGHDKDFSTPLSYPVDSLHEIYLVSYLYLAEAIKRHFALHQKRAKVVWHIVGHGLDDPLLVDLIARASELRPDQHMYLLIGPPAKTKRGCRSTFRRLADSLAPKNKNSIGEIHLTAAAYLARVGYRSLLEVRLTTPQQWVKALQPY